MDPVIEPETLLRELGAPDLRVIDCRFYYGQPQLGYARYRAGHIPGAVYLHLEDHLADPPGETGGRHPLPDPSRLTAVLESLGIGTDHHVVVYDDHCDVASRCWWVLTWLGHPRVQVLDGGFGAYEAAGGPVTDVVSQYPPARFVAHLRDDLVVTDPEEVEAAAHAGILVDSRSGPRYRGETEPLDGKAGHIPGARHFDWQKSFDARGRFRPVAELRARFRHLPTTSPVVYCGSGVTACANIVAMTRAGLTPRLYPGSWSDWISRPGRPIATGPEHWDPEEAEDASTLP